MRDAGLCAQVACIWEATARKPGNVHPGHDFEDATYVDFLLSAAAIAPVMTMACQQRVGTTVLEAVQATRRVVHSNTNLGMVLLLAPLAAVPEGEDVRSGVRRVLAGLDVEDARLAYRAIRLAAPGGLGDAREQDVRTEPTQSLRAGMTLAAPRDLVARQYANDFTEVFDSVATLLRGLSATGSLERAILFAYLSLLAQHPDTLIARKRGRQEAEEAARRARAVLEAEWPQTAEGWNTFTELDTWLRAEGHQRNPGTTADLITASLFVALRQEHISLPPVHPWC
jgi:triphosphoribosyl-dephospho-CoA synthase